jgi:uncharacterized protein YodC (DUF2158 family)
MDEFKSGDVVRLKSGGPVMTAGRGFDDTVEKKRMVYCQWWDDKKKDFNERAFYVDMLEAYKAPQVGRIRMGVI